MGGLGELGKEIGKRCYSKVFVENELLSAVFLDEIRSGACADGLSDLGVFGVRIVNDNGR